MHDAAEQLAGTDPASAGDEFEIRQAGPLSSQPLGGIRPFSNALIRYAQAIGVTCQEFILWLASLLLRGDLSWFRVP